MSVRAVAVSVFALASMVLPLAPRYASKMPAQAGASAPEGPKPVLLELFTSEGCSSCPPADALLARLGREEFPGIDIIALEEHVDYWDRLGWKDPFSSSAMTRRQQQYAQALGNGVFTPEMVADGRNGFVGSSPADAIKAIFAASASPKPDMHLEWTGNDNLAIRIEPLTNAGRDDVPEIFLVVAESKLHSDVSRGENAGRALDHNGVVRRLTKIGNDGEGTHVFSSAVKISAVPEWNRANLRAVVFVQERHSRRVLTAAAIAFPAG